MVRGGSGAYSSEMMEYFRLEGIAYNMVTLEESAAALRNAAFVEVDIRDRHAWNWRQLVLVLARGELRPGHLKAAKAPR
jgi:hypothetical protein